MSNEALSADDIMQRFIKERGDLFAPNHVRRLYRMGVTHRVIIEAGEGIAPVAGWSTVAHIAAQHMKRAYAYGVTKREVLEAVSCVLPMTGALTVQIGMRAMKLAE